jgi:hypothetical protein
MEAKASGEYAFFYDAAASSDLILIRVVGSPRPQVLRAKVDKIYSARKGVSADCLGAEIEFIGAPGHWGQETLEIGEKALVFVTEIFSGKLYEYAWRGHMVVEEIDGSSYASFQSPELWANENVPPEIRSNSRQDPRRSYRTAILFDVVETYLQNLIRKIDSCG